jgi:Ca2+-binding EF-hand superfamily protein
MHGSYNNRRQFHQPKPTTLENLALYQGVIESPQFWHPLVVRLRDYLAQRGTDGIGFSDLQRRFHTIDRDGTKTLHPEEFKNGLQKLNLNFPDHESSELFAFFDTYGYGYIDYEDFILNIRGPIHPRRRQLISTAWFTVDYNKEGAVDPEEVIGRYDASQHPDVRSGVKSSQEVFRDFLKAFEVSGELEGKVTRKEFENYYYNVSASIDRDDYFEQVMRYTWRLNDRWGENYWPGRRYRVTHDDGRESIEEVWSDFSFGGNDAWTDEYVRGRLRSQGYTPRSFSQYDGPFDPYYYNDGGRFTRRNFSDYGRSFGPSGYSGDNSYADGTYRDPSGGNFGQTSSNSYGPGSFSSGPGGYSSPRRSPRGSPRGSPRSSPRRYGSGY